MTSQIHASAALPTGKSPSSLWHVTWTSETVWILHGREKSVGLAGFEPFPSVTVLIVLTVAYKT